MNANKKPLKPRNPVARSPLMRKGGVHEKTKTVERRATKGSVEAELENWRDDVAFEESVKPPKKN